MNVPRKLFDLSKIWGTCGTPLERTFRQNLTADLAEKLGHTADEGVLIAGVAPGSVAAKAGLRKGDLILEIENQAIHSIAELKSAVEKVEDEIPILLLVKHEGQTRYVTVK